MVAMTVIVTLVIYTEFSTRHPLLELDQAIEFGADIVHAS
jgi:hypothetical protein